MSSKESVAGLSFKLFFKKEVISNIEDRKVRFGPGSKKSTVASLAI